MNSSVDSNRWLRAPLAFLLVVLSGNLVLRLTILVSDWSGMEIGLGALPRIFLVGALNDCVAALWPLLFGMLYVLVMPRRLLRTRVHGMFVAGLLWFASFLVILGFLSEWFFWEEFQSRLNFLAVDYLIYTTEVLDNIWESYAVVPLLGGLALACGGLLWLCRKWLGPGLTSPPSRSTALSGLTLVAFLLLVLHWFGSLEYAGEQENRFAGELEQNGLVTLVEAFQDPVIDYGENYACEPEEQAFVRVRELIADRVGQFEGLNAEDITRSYDYGSAERRHNVVLVVVESLSARYLGAFGSDKGLTPRLDALAEESLFFEKVFATGCRTVRGLESITLSIPPTPGRSLLKREANSGLCSIGSLMRRAGYDSKFFYGGYSYFDEMSGFFSSNGFDIVDRANLSNEEVTFSNAWGVCDQDLFTKVIAEADASYAEEEPFFSLVLTTSNHRPYTYPQVIDLPSGAGRDGAIKYTDFALGEMIDQAKKRPWFDDTIFVIVADHCASSAGKREINLAKHHIPLFMYAPALLQPARVDRLASQIDIAPTLLAILGQDHRSRFFGKDILDPAGGPERALVGNYQILGLYSEDKLTLLKPKRETASYSIGADWELQPMLSEARLVRDTIAYYQTPSLLLQRGQLSDPGK